MSSRLAAALVLAAVTAADAAPNIPSSELPGRERGRFQESPLDRFTQPDMQKTKPTWRWNCKPAKSKSKRRRSAGKHC